MNHGPVPAVRLVPWPPGDLDQLRRVNTAQNMEFLGGPETDEKLQARDEKYRRRWESGEGRQFRVAVDGAAATVGSIGYWVDEWKGQPVVEIGWTIEPAWWGRGIATAAVALVLEDAARHHPTRAVIAIVHEDNTASNALCRRLGFELAGQSTHENPNGAPILANEWVLVPGQRAREAAGEPGVRPSPTRRSGRG